MQFSKLPNWAQEALRTAVGTTSVRRGIARMQAEEGVLLLQLVHRDERALATVVQHPCRDVQDAYDKAALDMPPGEFVCYFVLATSAALERAESSGVCYMRAFSEVPGAGAILRVPVSLWTEARRA